ncbi:MAG: very-short-patch-repair endonuclease [Limisphaerales bacterium]|jgi:very-short-patch-repair endonuclease
MNKQSPTQTARAKALRQNKTWAENEVWSWLRAKRFSEFKFRRQHPVGHYVLDFFCNEAKLAIELDGSGHGYPERQKQDQLRDDWLEERGIEVLRIWNSRIRTDKEMVRRMIWDALTRRMPKNSQQTPSPSGRGQGEGERLRK